MLDGDDFLIGPHVLERLNAEYQNPDTWLTYAEYKQLCKQCDPRRRRVKEMKRVGEKTGKVPPMRCNHNHLLAWKAPVPLNIIRGGRLINHIVWPTHLRTFYVWLFKQLKLKDLLCQGTFFPRMTDLVTMFSLLEMADEHAKYIPKMLMFYNRMNALNVGKVLGRQHAKKVREAIEVRSRYQALDRSCFNEQIVQESSIGFILFYSEATQLTSVLDSLISQLNNVDRIAVVCLSDHMQSEDDRQLLQDSYPEITFFHNQSMQQMLLQLNVTHVLLADESTKLERTVDIRECLRWLQATGAYAFYLGYDAKLFARSTAISLIPVSKEVCGWQFASGSEGLPAINNHSLTLYRTTSINNACDQLKADTVADFLHQWSSYHVRSDEVGLFYT
jgi:hypothetical protein